jgi:hypothetical protein
MLTAIVRQFEIQPVEQRAVTFQATVSVTPSDVPVRLVPVVSTDVAPALTSRCPFHHADGPR